jgi:hypothetical protein
MTEETKQPEYTNFEIPVEEMTESQQLMLAILMQEGALRMRELIITRLESEKEDLTQNEVIAIVASTMPNVFGEVEDAEEAEKKD